MLSSLPTASMPAPTPALMPASTPPQPGPAAPDQQEEAHAFARQLQQAQNQDDRATSTHQTHTATHKSTAAKAAHKNGNSKTESTQGADARTAARTAAQPAAQPARKPAGTADGGTPAKAQAAEERTPADAAGSETGPQDLAALLAHLRGHSPDTAATMARVAAAGKDSEIGSAAEALARGGKGDKLGKGGRAADDTTGADGARARGSKLAASQADPASARDARTEGASTLTKDSLAAAQAQPPGSALESPLAAADAKPLSDTSTFSAALANASTLAAAVAGAAPGSTAAATPTSTATSAQAQLSAALGSPDFAPQLGTQICTFVRDGVQHAKLHLNPADMGPVTVQIQLDGQTAQVHLLADQAITRHALEQAMPQLAGSLRDAGLTLTGGGVFQQPRQTGGEAGNADGNQAGNQAGSSSNVAAVSAADAAGTRSMAAPRRRGVVDLVA